MSTPNPYAPPQAPVADVAQPSAEKADRLLRLLAALIDGLFVAVLVYVPLLAGLPIKRLLEMRNHPDPAWILSVFAGRALFASAGFAIWAIITIVLVTRNAQTVGKKLMSIKVARVNGAKASLGRIFWLRNVVNALIGGLLPIVGLFYWLADFLWIFGSQRRCLHDYIADTIVIKV